MQKYKNKSKLQAFKGSVPLRETTCRWMYKLYAEKRLDVVLQIYKKK